MKVSKWKYLKVIQQNCGQGWEDVSEYETNSSGQFIDPKDRFVFPNDFVEYCMMRYPTRKIERKVKNGSDN